MVKEGASEMMTMTDTLIICIGMLIIGLIIVIKRNYL